MLKERAQRTDWADYLRVTATIAVILLHIAANLVSQFGKIYTGLWWYGNLIDSSLRFCVPIFVMLTGTLLLGRDLEIKDFLKKRLFRVVLPLLFWSIIYIIYFLNIKYSNWQEASFAEVAGFIFKSLKFGAAYHLWYIYMIVGIYLFIPIIGKWIRNCTEKEILYFLFIWLCTLFLNQPIIYKFKLNIDLTYFSGYIGYLVLGYYLSIKKFNNIKKTKLIALSLLLAGIGITAFGTYFASSYKSVLNGAFYAYLTPNVLITAVGVFLLFRIHNFTKPNYVLIFINKYSYGIYLAHVLVISYLAKLGITWQFISPVYGIPITAAICLLASTLIVFAINKLPYGKYISG